MNDESDVQRVERVLQEGLERLDSERAARVVVARLERLSTGATEAERGAEAAASAETPRAAADQIERAARKPKPHHALVDALATAAAESVAPAPGAPKIADAATATFKPSAPVSPRAERGRRLLRDAALQRMGPIQKLDARVYVLVNGSPHPGWLDNLTEALAIITIGGWIWVLGVLAAYVLRVPRAASALVCLLPCVVGATWIVEHPVKAYFRRRRPFVEIVRALVIGKKPGSWSFPSGHTASSLPGAWILSRVWPRSAPLFMGLASTVGVSRVYVGAHYPGDVLSGALAGIVLAELIRRLQARLFR